MKNFNAKDMLNNIDIWNKNKPIREQREKEKHIKEEEENKIKYHQYLDNQENQLFNKIIYELENASKNGRKQIGVASQYPTDSPYIFRNLDDFPKIDIQDYNIDNDEIRDNLKKRLNKLGFNIKVWGKGEYSDNPFTSSKFPIYIIYPKLENDIEIPYWVSNNRWLIIIGIILLYFILK